MPFGQDESSAGTAPPLSAAIRRAASSGTGRADLRFLSNIQARTVLGAHLGFSSACRCSGARAQDVAVWFVEVSQSSNRQLRVAFFFPMARRVDNSAGGRFARSVTGLPAKSATLISSRDDINDEVRGAACRSSWPAMRRRRFTSAKTTAKPARPSNSRRSALSRSSVAVGGFGSFTGERVA